MGCFISLLRHSKSPFKRFFSRRRSAPVYFKGPAHRQDFDLPDPIMYYIAKNASNAAVFRKLVQSCKYFFIKRPLIVISCMHESKDGCSTCLIDKDGHEKFDIEKIPAKLLWLAGNFDNICTLPEDNDGPPSASSLKIWIPKFYRVEASELSLRNLTLTLEEVVFLGSRKAKILYLQNSIVQYENGESVQLETLLAQFPLLENFFYKCHLDGSNISINTVNEILSNPNFSKMKAFHLIDIPDTFDIDSFYTYLKSRDDFYCCLCFRSDIAEDYRERIEAIIDELLSSETTSFWFPNIYIPNMHRETYKAMKNRVEEECKRHNINNVILHL